MSSNAKMPLDPKEPLYIIELGVGSGKFTYFMLKALEEMKETCKFPFDNFVYVMTDFTEANYKFWMNHPALKPYFESGRLDAGIFDAVNDDSIHLHFSGKTLSKNSTKNPICIVANYLFDTLYHDIFQVEQGDLKEGLVSVGSRHPTEPDPLDPEIITRLDNEYKYRKIDAETYYNDEDGDEPYIRRILKWYQEYFRANASGASILLPIGALRALRKLCKFSNGRAIVISGDKGNNNPDQFIGLIDPHIAVHGSFSLMVNYHAIGAWFTNQGGFTLNNPQEEASLKVGCFILQNDDSMNRNVSHDHSYLGENIDHLDEERSKHFPYLKQAFHDFMDSFGPNDFFVLQKSLKEDITNPPLRTVISILKLSDWDPDVFFKFRDVILNQAPTAGIKLKNDLSRGIPRVWKNYYMMDLEKDIAFEIGRYYYGIRNYEEALKFYTESVKTIGEHHVTCHNQGLCQYSLGKLDIALQSFEKAVRLNSDYHKARSWIEKVTKELSIEAAAASNMAKLDLGANEDATDNGNIESKFNKNGSEVSKVNKAANANDTELSDNDVILAIEELARQAGSFL